MDYGIKPKTYEVKCVSCKTKFSYTSCGVGPVSTCNECYGLRLEEIWGPDWKTICVLFR